MESLKEQLQKQAAAINSRWLKLAKNADEYLDANVDKLAEKIRGEFMKPANWSCQSPNELIFKVMISFPGCIETGLLDFRTVFDYVKKRLVETSFIFSDLVWKSCAGDRGMIHLKKKVDLNDRSEVEAYFQDANGIVFPEEETARLKTMAAESLEKAVAAAYEKLLNKNLWHIPKHKFNGKPETTILVDEDFGRYPDLMEKFTADFRARAEGFVVEKVYDRGFKVTLKDNEEEKEYQWRPSTN